jgi:hypothetical protein
MEVTDFLVREISNRMRRLLGNAEQCLGQLDEGHVWYRAHPRDNAIGNLILHIVGTHAKGFSVESAANPSLATVQPNLVQQKGNQRMN